MVAVRTLRNWEHGAFTEHNSPLAVTYARSLLELANDRRIAVETGRELEGLGQILEAEPVFREYLADPAVRPADSRTASIQKIFKGRVSELIYNFLEASLRHSLAVTQISRPGVMPAYRETGSKRPDFGNVEVNVTTAHQLSNDELEQVKSSINKALNKNALVHLDVDESIIGGVVKSAIDDQSHRRQRQTAASLNAPAASSSGRRKSGTESGGALHLYSPVIEGRRVGWGGRFR